MNVGLQKAIRYCGRQKDLAKILNVRPQTISVWVKRGVVPPARVGDVVEAVNGTVTRHALNPIFPPEVRAFDE